MSYIATTRFRDGSLYNIGDSVPEVIALANLACVAGPELADVAEDPSLVERPASDDDAITLMLGEVARLEGLDVVPVSKAQISQILLVHYLEVGLVEMPQSAPDLVKPVPVIFEEPIVDTVDGDVVAGEAVGKPTPEMFGDPIVDPVLPELDPKMTVKALTQIAEAETVMIGEGATKAEIIGAIAAKRAADNPGPRQEGLE